MFLMVKCHDCRGDDGLQTRRNMVLTVGSADQWHSHRLVVKQGAKVVPLRPDDQEFQLLIAGEETHGAACVHHWEVTPGLWHVKTLPLTNTRTFTYSFNVKFEFYVAKSVPHLNPQRFNAPEAKAARALRLSAFLA